jgi:hypothetical protein
MHDEDIRRPASTPAAEDERTQRALLTQVLTLHPERLTLSELARLLGGGEDFAAGDAVKRAAEELAGDGLLTHGGGAVAPSRAALRFDRLLGGVS